MMLQTFGGASLRPNTGKKVVSVKNLCRTLNHKTTTTLKTAASGQDSVEKDRVKVKQQLRLNMKSIESNDENMSSKVVQLQKHMLDRRG